MNVIGSLAGRLRPMQASRDGRLDVLARPRHLHLFPFAGGQALNREAVTGLGIVRGAAIIEPPHGLQ